MIGARRGTRPLWILCVLGTAGLGGCRGGGPPPILPPIPASSGQVLMTPAAPPSLRDGQILLDRVVAEVNGDVIMMSELQEALILHQRETPSSEDGPGDVQRKVLDRMVVHRLQVQEARRERIEVTEEDVRAVVDDFVQRNGGDRGQVEGQLRLQGLTWDGLRRELREQLLAQRIRMRRVGRRATVTEAEVEAYLAENRAKLEAGLKYHAWHVAVLAEPRDQPAAWERAKGEIEAVAARLREGADIATLGSPAAGVDLGWLARGELEPLFEEPLLRLPAGGTTEPIRSAAGYHLFRLQDRERLTPEMLAEARQQARDLLLQRKAQERFDEWVEGLRRRALIAIRL